MPDISRPRILIADDREENRYILTRILDAAGYQCIQSATGRGALEMARTLPEVLILDVSLPDMSGYEVCQKIKSDPLTSSVSVLQISASFVSIEDRVRALEAGADGYLTHPIDRMVLVATVRSLVRLRTAEIEARRAAQQWQTTFDALQEGIALIGADGGFVRWNDALTRICGSNAEIKAGQDAASFFERLLGTGEPLKANGPFRGEFPIAKRTVHLSIDSVAGENEAPEKILILTDITDSKLAEYALRAAEKLSATGRLANSIAHEINNPLEALTNLLYLAQSSSSLASIHDLLARADTELLRIARITRQSLAFHRDSEKPMPVDVSALVSEVVSLLGRSTSLQHVRLVSSGQRDLTIRGFPGQLNQVLVNLVRNAAEASPPDSEVVIRVKSVHRGGQEGVRITIHDRGPGIPEEFRERLFDPFFTTKGLKGSGLGLWVSKALIVKHHGTIRFRSSERAGKSGTTFEVFLPLESAARNPVPIYA
jgi:signal transduction histidine kinase